MKSMMICFLTSRADDPITLELNTANRFVDELNECLPRPCKVLYICSDPENHEITDLYGNATKECFENAGFVFESFDTLDKRNIEEAESLIRQADLIILAGGHVPTQNDFFHEIGLKELLKDYDGVLIGISAGSMNSARIVYAQPEEEGEAIDPSYEKFIEGLGLTETMLCPHYQEVKNDVLDGFRLFEDITYGDSMGKTFYAIPDGTYLFVKDGKEELRGEAYRIKDGEMRRISSVGDVVVLK